MGVNLQHMFNHYPYILFEEFSLFFFMLMNAIKLFDKKKSK
jgi:hypothetical protein